MKIKENAKKGVISTITGIVIIVAAIVSVFVIDNIGWTEAGIAIGIGATFIGLIKK